MGADEEHQPAGRERAAVSTVCNLGEQANTLGFRRFLVRLLWDEVLSTADHVAKVAKVLRR